MIELLKVLHVLDLLSAILGRCRTKFPGRLVDHLNYDVHFPLHHDLGLLRLNQIHYSFVVGSHEIHARTTHRHQLVGYKMLATHGD